MFLDEAQRIPEIGLTAKIIVDQFKDVQLILSGSSSFDLYNEVNEPLTGRKWSFNLWPVSWEEWQNHSGYVKAAQDLENRLVFGFYPDVLVQEENQAMVLSELSESYLYKDILISERMKQISNELPRNYYFWRTTQQQEVDYVEEVNGTFYGYEFKWNERKKIKFPLTFTKNYDAYNFGINKTNFREFVIPTT